MIRNQSNRITNIEKGKTYICLKDLHSNVGPAHFAFLKGKEYKAEKDNALYGEDNISYSLPAAFKLEDWFKEK